MSLYRCTRAAISVMGLTVRLQGQLLLRGVLPIYTSHDVNTL